MRRPPLLLLTLLLAVSGCGAPPPATNQAQSAQPVALAPRPEVDLSAYEKGRSQPVKDPVFPAYGNPAIDVLHYDLTLGWKPSSRTLTGTAKLTLRAVKPVTRLTVDFGRALKVDQVTVNGTSARPRHTGNDLSVPLAKPLKAGEGAVVTVRYHGRPRPVDAKQRRKDISMLGFHTGDGGRAWALQEPFGAFTWFPVNDHPSDEALYDVAITVPKGWSGVAHGTFKGKSTKGRTSTFRWKSTDPVASYLTVFAADKFRMYKDKGPRGIPITYWIRPQDTANSLAVAHRTPAIMKWLEKKLGPYPFPSAGLVATSDSGMETQQMIALGPRFMEPSVVAHELAHHWFGNTVTPRTWRDLWLNEGFAMYFELQWYADDQGHSIDPYIASIRRLDAKLRKENGPPGRYRRDSFAQSNVYYGPAIMLHEIRERLGDKRFFAMTKAWPQEHRNTTQDRASFIKWINEHTGEDFTELIDTWLDSTTTPR
ncbi:M1 family metallopeptidase [Nonomuraea turcica]|uniref:M1 family metallopeptidase n=1 Tax=Nonomuraea sp. G32 TaxID=3067274 RepID=UPI00273C80BF|nr:M1 family metallopeptidase [Nonomuraea sp. G32]MDP4507985.1 M1 family metallopeptidase [Nonomuraea sp. G32]